MEEMLWTERLHSETRSKKKDGEMAVIKEDSFLDHRPITVISKCQVKETKRRGTKQTKRLDLSKFENEGNKETLPDKNKRMCKCEDRGGSKLESDEQRTNGVNRRSMCESKETCGFTMDKRKGRRSNKTKRGDIRKNPENERNRRTKVKCRGR